MMEQETVNLDSLENIKRKLEILLAGRFRKKENMIKSIEVQNRLSKKSGSWNGAKEIRKWREKI